MAAAEPTLRWRVAAIEGVWLHGDTRAGSSTVGTSAIGTRGLLEPGFSCLESQGACPALLHRRFRGPRRSRRSHTATTVLLGTSGWPWMRSDTTACLGAWCRGCRWRLLQPWDPKSGTDSPDMPARCHPAAPAWAPCPGAQPRGSCRWVWKKHRTS